MNRAEEDAFVDRVYADWIAQCVDGQKSVAELVRLAIRAAVAHERERCARVCEEPEPECCNRPIIRSNGEVDGCCGSPEPRQKTAEECAAAIRRGTE